MSIEITDLKNSLRIDEDETDDDVLLKTYIDTALAFIKGAIGDGDEFYKLESIEPLVDTATLALASGYYTGRSALSLVTLTPVDLATNSIIGQLRGRYLVWLEEGDDDGS